MPSGETIVGSVLDFIEGVLPDREKMKPTVLDPLPIRGANGLLF